MKKQKRGLRTILIGRLERHGPQKKHLTKTNLNVRNYLISIS